MKIKLKNHKEILSRERENYAFVSKILSTAFPKKIAKK